MERRLLITVGDDPDFLYGVRFVGSFFKNKDEMELALLHVAPRFDSMDAKEDLRLHEMDHILSGIYARKGQQALELSQKILVGEGFPRRRISSKLIQKHYGMIADIIEEAKQGNYHAIVLGRRGYSIFEKILYPKLPEEVLDLDLDLPLWICRRPERGLKDVLLCVDGSESCFRAAEHVGLMMEKEEHHGITILHVHDGSSRHAERITGTAKRKLLDCGIGEDRIGMLVVEGPDAAKAIRGEASGGPYAVVALGRHGAKIERAPDKRFMGSTTLELLGTLERSALWAIR